MAGRTSASRFFSYGRQALGPIGSILGGIFGGPVGAAAGGALGSGASSGIHALDQYFMQKYPPAGTAVPEQEVTAAGNYGRYNVQDLPGGAQAVQYPLRTPYQEELEKERAEMGRGVLRGLPQAQFEPLKAEYERQYTQQVLPALIEQFVSAAPGAMRTGGFQQAVGSSRSDLQSRMAALQQQFNMQQRGQEQQYGMNLMAPALGQQFGTGSIPGQPSDWAPLAGTAAQSAMAFAPDLLGGIGSLLEGLVGKKQPSEEEDKQKELMNKLLQMLVMQKYKNASLNQQQQ